jgi:hypothetical protein
MNIEYSSPEKYAELILKNYLKTLSSGVSRNFVQHYAKQCALNDIESSIKLWENIAPPYLSYEPSLNFLKETKNYIVSYQF